MSIQSSGMRPRWRGIDANRPLRQPLPVSMKWGLAVWLAASGVVLAAPEFTPRQVVKPFEAIRDPKIVPAAKAGDWVRDDELVLGVVVNGAARAYPINMLTSPTREIINDKLGGRAIAATW